MSQINEILTGWGNIVKDYFNALDPVTKLISKRRLEICHVCHMRDGNFCSKKRLGENIITGEQTKGCGCNLSAKAVSPESQCPLSKW